MTLTVIPLTLRQANALVDRLNRHHKPVVGCRFAIGVQDRIGHIVGAAIVGRPVARKTDQYRIAEIVRLVTDGHKHHACSKLYSACARAAREMGFERIQTFILDCEPGTSLIAAGWEFDGVSEGADGWQSRDGRRDDQPTVPKQRRIKRLNRPALTVDDLFGPVTIR